MTDTVATPSMFGDRDFAELNQEQFDAYVEYKVQGHHAHVAFRRVFGEMYMDSVSHVRIELTEHNPYVRERFAKRIREVKVSEVWNDKIAVNELLSMARNPFAKDSTRLNAMRELNVLIGITVIDENGKTKAGRNLNDFYDSLPKGS